MSFSSRVEGIPHWAALHQTRVTRLRRAAGLDDSERPSSAATAAMAHRVLIFLRRQFGFFRGAAAVLGPCAALASVSPRLARAQGLPSFDVDAQGGWRL